MSVSVTQQDGLRKGRTSLITVGSHNASVVLADPATPWLEVLDIKTHPMLHSVAHEVLGNVSLDLGRIPYRMGQIPPARVKQF